MSILILPGTHVIAITAIDADDPNTPHTKIAYRVIQQEPDGQRMFQIHRSSGEIKVQVNGLDREVRASATKCIEESQS